MQISCKCNNKNRPLVCSNKSYTQFRENRSAARANAHRMDLHGVSHFLPCMNARYFLRRLSVFRNNCAEIIFVHAGCVIACSSASTTHVVRQFVESKNGCGQICARVKRDSMRGQRDMNEIKIASFILSRRYLAIINLWYATRTIYNLRSPDCEKGGCHAARTAM